MARRRVMVIGLDGATWDLIRPWTETGELPNLKRLMDAGSWGPLTSTIPPRTSPAWTSYATGVNPGKHGIFDHIYRKPGSYELGPVHSGLCAVKRLWELIGEQGGRVAVINVPLTYPPIRVNGVMITGMFTPSKKVVFSYPPDLVERIEREVGEYILASEVRPKGDLDRLLGRLHETQESRTRAVLHLLGQEAWDFFMVVFNTTDIVQHKFWQFTDERFPAFHTEQGRGFRDAIRSIYRRVDGDLGRILERAGDATVIIMSDHGAGPVLGYFISDNWLLSRGWMEIRPRPGARMKYLLNRLGVTPLGVLRSLAKLKMGIATRSVRVGRKDSVVSRLFLSWRDIGWERTRAYSIGNLCGQLFLNLRGREPQGIIEPGDQYIEVRRALMDEIAEIRDPHTGEPLVERIYTREEIYHGPFVDRAPDVVFFLKGDRYMAFTRRQFSSNLIFEDNPRISGAHRMNGIVLMCGEGIRRGARLNNAHIVDLAPTILRFMGHGVPREMDGRFLEEAFEPWFVAQLADNVQDADIFKEQEPFAYSDVEEGLVKERLKGLGYIE